MNIGEAMDDTYLEEIDFREDEFFHTAPSILKTLLYDHSTKKNILWMTDNYISNGYAYDPKNEINIDLITNEHKGLIRPRVQKSTEEQIKRSREKAEVFTPSWICNKQNNLIDTQWFKRDAVFNLEKGTTWETNNKKIEFSKTGKTWKDYVLSNRLEITCGEAPYLVSRYDTTSGEFIEVKDRIGLLDRKLRIVKENTTTEKEWFEWVKKAYQSTYGFEWQGDNLLLARENFILTFIDYYRESFECQNPSLNQLQEIAEIVSWNLWQMDGIKFVVPESCHEVIETEVDLFGEETTRITPCEGCKNEDINKHNGVQCLIKDWKENRVITALSLIKGDKE